MHCKLKALGLALVAALALTAVMASAASAQFTSNKEHTIYSGSQKTGTNDVFSAGEGFGGITCVTVTYSGTSTSTTEHVLVLQPTYSDCKDSFGRTVDIDNKNLTQTYTSGVTGGELKGTVHISGGMTLTVTSGGSIVCTIEIKSPQVNNGITYNNLGGTKGVEITRHSTNVVSTVHGGFLNCGLATGEHKAGTYDGTSVITGKDTAGNPAEFNVD